MQTNEIKGFGGRLWQEILHVRELRVRPAQALRQGPSKGTTKHYQSLPLSDLVMTSCRNMGSKNNFFLPHKTGLLQL